MADTKTDKPVDAPKPPQTADSEREKDVLIARLQGDVKRLTAEIEARDALDKERAEAEAKAKAAKVAFAVKVPVALVSMLGEGRRQIAPKSQLRDSELAGLTEGVHFEFVALGT